MDVSYNGIHLTIDGQTNEVVGEEDEQAVIDAIVQHRIKRRKEWEAEQERIGQVWIAKYWRWCTSETERLYSMKDALSFFKHGVGSETLSPESITCPDGTVIKDLDWEVVNV